MSARVESGPGPRESAVLVLVVAGMYGLGGSLLRMALGEVGLLAASWLFLFAPCVAWLLGSGRDVRRSLSLRVPSARQLGGAALLALGALPIVLLVGWLQSFVVVLPAEVSEGLRAQVTAGSPGRLLWLLFLVAVTPAVCEETVFRGVLLTGTRPLGGRRAVVLNGLVFGAFHLSDGALARFLPTACLGIVIGWAVWRSGSLVVGIVMHGLNNAVIVVSATLVDGSGFGGDPGAAPGPWVLSLATTACVIGVILLLERPSAGQTPFNEEP